MEPDAIDVMPERDIDIDDPDLDIARPQYTVEHHGKPPVRFAGSGGTSARYS
jgi:hypothetical protein